MKEQEELLADDLPKTWPEIHLGLTWKRITLIAVLVILAGVYLGNLFFGANSLDAMWQIQEYESTLSQEVKQLKEDNALMQKEYFELKEITNGE
jgi:hypothetical protein